MYLINESVLQGALAFQFHTHTHTHTETSMIQSTLSSHQGWVVDVEWSSSNEHQLLSGSYDSTLKLWDIRSSKLPLYTIAAHEGKVLCCDWSLPKVGHYQLAESEQPSSFRIKLPLMCLKLPIYVLRIVWLAISISDSSPFSFR